MKIQSRRMPNPVDANWIPIRIGPPNQLHRSPESIEYVAITEAHRGTDRIRTNACMHTCDQTDARDTVGTFRSPSARVQIFRSKGGCFCQNYFQQTRACPLRRVLFTWLLRWFHPWNYNLVNGGGGDTYWFFGVEVSSLSMRLSRLADIWISFPQGKINCCLLSMCIPFRMLFAAVSEMNSTRAHTTTLYRVTFFFVG